MRGIKQAMIGVLLSCLSSMAIAYHIVLYAPFSGEYQNVGESMRHAIALANETMMKKPMTYAVIDTDNVLTNPKALLTTYVKTHKTDLIISEGSVNGLVAKYIAQQSHVLHFSLASDPLIADGQLSFLIWSPADVQATLVVNHLKKLGVQKIAFLRVNHLWADVIGSAVLKKLKKTTIQVVMNDTFETNTADFTPYLSKISKLKPDIMYVMGFKPDMMHLYDDMQKNKISIPLTGVIERLSPAVKKLFNHQWYVDTRDMPSSFIEQYERKFNQPPVTEGAYTYMMMGLLNDMFRQLDKHSESMTPQHIASRLFTMKGDSIMGAYYFRKNGILVTPSSIKTIRGNRVLIL
jgi:ABC-type branched-subunit amino acid transport system substrate-binding protein